MKKTIVLGHDCPDGKLEACPFDEKNLTTDWIEDFLFEGNVSKENYGSRLCGYINLSDDDMLCEVEHDGNCLTYRFPGYNFIDRADIEKFSKALEEYLGDCDNLTIEVFAIEDRGDFNPTITVKFYSRYDS